MAVNLKSVIALISIASGVWPFLSGRNETEKLTISHGAIDPEALAICVACRCDDRAHGRGPEKRSDSWFPELQLIGYPPEDLVLKTSGLGARRKLN